MSTKSRIDLLRQAAGATLDVTTATTEQLVETARLCGQLGSEANSELHRRRCEQKAAERRVREEQRAQAKAESERRRLEQARLDAEEESQRAERQAERDEQEARQARAYLEAAGLKPVPLFSHPR